MDHPAYLEHQEGPDGQHLDLLNRVLYDRQRVIEIGLRNARNTLDEYDAALRGMAWTAADVSEYKVGCVPAVRHLLTDDMTEDLGKASAAVIQPWRVRASELYNEWYQATIPGPKGSTRKPGSPIPTSGKSTKAHATGGPR